MAAIQSVAMVALVLAFVVAPWTPVSAPAAEQPTQPAAERPTQAAERPVRPAAEQPVKPAAEQPVKMVVLGDSLAAGHGLPGEAAFPARLEQALKAKGLAVEVANAGVSGDTASGGLARLDWSVPEGTDAVILELGANDMLRGIDPKVTRAALEEIVRRLVARRIVVLIAGMWATPNLGPDYGRDFEAIYADLAAKNGLLLYPFFLEGVAADPKLNQRDGTHPTAAGVDAIVKRILPKVEELVAQARQHVRN